MGRLETILQHGQVIHIAGLRPEVRLLAAATMRVTSPIVKQAADEIVENRSKLYSRSLPEMVWCLARLNLQKPAVLLAKEAQHRIKELQTSQQGHCIASSLSSIRVSDSEIPNRFKKKILKDYPLNLRKQLRTNDKNILDKVLSNLGNGRYSVFALPEDLMCLIFYKCAKLQLHHHVLEKLSCYSKYIKSNFLPQIIWSLSKLGRVEDVRNICKNASNKIFKNPTQVTMVAWSLKTIGIANRNSSDWLADLLSLEMTPKMIAFCAWSLSDSEVAQKFISDYFVKKCNSSGSMNFLSLTDFSTLLRRTSEWQPSEHRNALVDCLTTILSPQDFRETPSLSNIIRGLTSSTNIKAIAKGIDLYTIQLEEIYNKLLSVDLTDNYILQNVDLAGVLQAVAKIIGRLKPHSEDSVTKSANRLFSVSNKVIVTYLELVRNGDIVETPFAIPFFTYCAWSFAVLESVSPSPDFISGLSKLYYAQFDCRSETEEGNAERRNHCTRMLSLYLYGLKRFVILHPSSKIHFLAKEFVYRSGAFLMRNGLQEQSVIQISVCVSSSRRILLPKAELTPEFKLLCVEYLAQKGFLKPIHDIDDAAISSILFDLNCNKVSQWVTRITNVHGLSEFNGRSLATMASSHSIGDRVNDPFWDQLSETVASRQKSIKLNVVGCVAFVRAYRKIKKPLSPQLALLVITSLNKLSLEGLSAVDAAAIVLSLSLTQTPCTDLYIRLAKVIEMNAASLHRGIVSQVTRAFVSKKIVTPELFSALRKSMSRPRDSDVKDTDTVDKSSVMALIDTPDGDINKVSRTLLS